MIMRIAVVACVLLLAGCAAQGGAEPPADNAALVEDGRAIAEAQCAGCHAVGEYGDSPNPAAPPFRTVLTRYRAEVLEEELINGIQVAHPMPNFQFNPQGADALMAYLRSIQASGS
jgi:mono/diheme cytochrome c family protein